MAQISMEEAHQLIPDADQLYNGLIRNQVFLPPRKDPLCTVRFLRGVWQKKFWVIRPHEVRTVKVCADPPKRKLLARLVANIMKNYPSVGEPIDSGMKRTAVQIKKRPPCVQWLLLVLSTLDPDHEIF